MENKISKLLGAMEYEELKKVKRDLDSGALLMQHIVNKKINDVETSSRKTCASCGKFVCEEKDEIYTVVFGNKTIKKKASFCALDCLEGFLKDLKQIKQTTLKSELSSSSTHF